MHFDVVLSVFIHPCSKSGGELNLVFTQSWRGCLCACASDVCVCVCFRCVCVCARFRCVCVRFRCVCASDVCVCVCARVSDVCVRFRCVCARFRCVCAPFRCVRGNLLTQCSTVTETIPSVLYARLVPSGSPYIESWYARLNENTRVGCNA